MEIELNNISKKFGKDWILKNLSIKLSSKNNYVILGNNGSGKSTLLQIISGIVSPTKGEISYTINETKISATEIYKYLSICTPYLNLYEELTLIEAIEYHFKFKKINSNISIEDTPSLLLLEESKNKAIRDFSSGMKQRLKLGLSILSETPLLLLDEPTSNLDKKGIMWYKNMINTYANDKLIMVCSNEVKDEYEFCDKQILISDYK